MAKYSISAPEIDIDSDIEQKISQLQEGRLDGSIKPTYV